MKLVTLYSRTGCHLCEAAIEKIKSIKSDLNFDLEIKLIDGDQQLEKKYGEQVPVILIDNQPHDFWRVDLDRFRSAIKN
ncbi:MAG: glutaredoxin family protein [Actinobacteria bacterium]|nr:glutaredoxin family protein [Actinomycetota bacterium]